MLHRYYCQGFGDVVEFSMIRVNISHITISLFVVLLFSVSCQRSRDGKTYNGFAPAKKDTIEIYNNILNYPDFNQYLAQAQVDTVFLITNENLTSNYSLTLTGKILSYTEKPKGYPKEDEHFDFNRLLISFQDLKIEKDTAVCYCFVKSMGLLGKFSLIKKDSRWHISSYEKIMI